MRFFSPVSQSAHLSPLSIPDNKNGQYVAVMHIIIKKQVLQFVTCLAISCRDIKIQGNNESGKYRQRITKNERQQKIWRHLHEGCRLIFLLSFSTLWLLSLKQGLRGYDNRNKRSLQMGSFALEKYFFVQLKGPHS